MKKTATFLAMVAVLLSVGSILHGEDAAADEPVEAADQTETSVVPDLLGMDAETLREITTRFFLSINTMNEKLEEAQLEIEKITLAQVEKFKLTFDRLKTMSMSLRMFIENKGLLEEWRTWRDGDEGIDAVADRIDSTPSFQPEGSYSFTYDQEVTLEDSQLVESIEFTEHRCNMTLRNMTGRRSPVDLQVVVMNRDGVVLWSGREEWLFQKLDVEEKYLSSLKMDIHMPDSLKLSVYSKTFDTKPAWFTVLNLKP